MLQSMWSQRVGHNLGTEHQQIKRLGFPGGSVVKNPFANAREVGSALGSRSFPGERSGNPLQYFCLGNPMGRGVWQAVVHGLTKELDMALHLNNNKAHSNRRSRLFRKMTKLI